MELTLRHNPMLDDADCEAILAIHAAVGWDRRMPPAELRTLYQHSGYSAYLFTDATLGTEAFFRRHGIHIQQVLEKTLRDQSGT